MNEHTNKIIFPTKINAKDRKINAFAVVYCVQCVSDHIIVVLFCLLASGQSVSM